MHMNGKTRLTAGEISALTEKAPVKAEHELRENLVIIPTYNEAINLKLLVPSVLAKGPFDVLIVDDNSPDGTGEVAETLAKRFVGRVEVLHRSGKLGLGTAYLAGGCRLLARPQPPAGAARDPGGDRRGARLALRAWRRHATLAVVAPPPQSWRLDLCPADAWPAHPRPDRWL